MKKPFLSICIPTYNRERYLRDSLENIIHQDGFDDDIEIVISDNASPDGTRMLVEGYTKKYKNIHYSRNDTNLGADRNVLKALLLGTGEYVWGITDDDIILNGGIRLVKNTIREFKDKDIVFFQTNFDTLNKDGVLIQERFLTSDKSIKSYTNIHKLYQSYSYKHNGLTFFSINIFHSSVLQYGLDDIPMTNFPHSCLMGLLPNKKAVFIGPSVIGYRTENNSDNFSSIRFFFFVFVIGHAKYMFFLWKNHSLVSQLQLFYILGKMVIYSGYLSIRSILHRVKILNH